MILFYILKIASKAKIVFFRESNPCIFKAKISKVKSPSIEFKKIILQFKKKPEKKFLPSFKVTSFSEKMV